MSNANNANSSSNTNNSVLPRSHSPAHTNVDAAPRQPPTTLELFIISLDALFILLVSYLLLYLITTKVIFRSDEQAKAPFLWVYLLMICTSTLTVCLTVFAGATGRSGLADVISGCAQAFYGLEVLILGFTTLATDSGFAWPGNGPYYADGLVLVGFVAGMVRVIGVLHLDARESAEGKKDQDHRGYLIFWGYSKIRNRFRARRPDDVIELQGNQSDGSSSGKVVSWSSRLGLTSLPQEHERVKLLDGDSVDTLV